MAGRDSELVPTAEEQNKIGTFLVLGDFDSISEGSQSLSRDGWSTTTKPYIDLFKERKMSFLSAKVRFSYVLLSLSKP